MFVEYLSFKVRLIETPFVYYRKAYTISNSIRIAVAVVSMINLSKKEVKILLHLYRNPVETTYSNMLAKEDSFTQPTAWRSLQSLKRKGVVRIARNESFPKKYKLSDLGKAIAWWTQLDKKEHIGIYKSKNGIKK